MASALPGYVDDPTIADADDLWRRVPTSQVVKDDNSGQLRPSSACFDDSSDSPMSVLLAREDTVERVHSKYPADLLAALTAGLVRARNQGVCRDPTPDDASHALVFGKKTGSTRSAFAKAARWVIGP